MREEKKQPAYRGFFFGPGYKTTARAIRLLWLKNADSAQDYLYELEETGLLCFVGAYFLLCAISVVTFGTVFSLAISLVTVIVLAIFFLLVYMGFAFVWLLDRGYLLRNKVFTACHECKAKVLIPTYLCPGCGREHTNLTPGVYGILKRTCLCGRKLPATFFNGRGKLPAICPICRKGDRTTVLQDQESRPLCVPVVGGRSVGKTAYITAFSREFIETIAPARGIEIEPYNQDKAAIYREISADYLSGNTRMTARSADVNVASAVSFSFFIRHDSLKPARLLHIYDIAGEVFTDGRENEVQRQYEYCHGILFIVDPFAIPSVVAQYGDRLTPEDRAGIGHADINGVIDVFLNKLREVTGLSDQRMSHVPLAVVLSKADSAGLDEVFDAARIEQVRAEHGKKVDAFDAMDYLCRAFLREHQMHSFLSSIDMRFTTNRFFAASAIGHTRGAGHYQPRGILEPMEWICSLSDKRLHECIGTHAFTAKPLLKTKP